MLLKAWLDEARGRGAALARHLGVPPSMITKMASGEKRVPLEHCPFIQEFTNGQVTCEELRPDQVKYFQLLRAQCGAAGEDALANPPAPAPADGAAAGVAVEG